MISAALGDDIIAAVMVVYCINLLPVLLNSNTRFAWYASAITAVGLFVMSAVFFSWELTISGITSVVQGTLWAGIALFRSGKRIILDESWKVAE